ncbi:response regulator [Saccharibacillus sp. CPCC 101409]|uniref:response regulator n=1 Tax=Saccharibacillus sp. CPCC 101409 TaxID=3058041 RepID=UPI00267340A2|nr:response regulator [Saccharibacillus sp. CPCC 101409]MDO3411379.1 response regulator [Saccharibacillus sp. CPCC 101409]
MNKYQKLFMHQAGENLGAMLDPDARTSEWDVYRMLHSIKGTAGTIGLRDWHDEAVKLLERFGEEGERTFTGAELADDLAPLARLLEAGRRTEPPAVSVLPEEAVAEPGTGNGQEAELEQAEPQGLRAALRRAFTGRDGASRSAARAPSGAGEPEADSEASSSGRRASGAAPEAGNAPAAGPVGPAAGEADSRAAESERAVSGASSAEAPRPAGAADPAGTVLLLDDDLGLLALLKDRLEDRGYTVFATPRLDKAVEWFYEMRPDCAVFDMLLPEQSGFSPALASALPGDAPADKPAPAAAPVERLRELCERYMIPVVLTTTRPDDRTRLFAYESGADDFLTKPLNPEEFIVRVGRLIRRRRRLTGLLLLDQTTGAYAMPFLEQELTRQIGLLGEAEAPLALAAVELDGLRRLNERTGYLEGDRLLRAFSEAVRRELRPGDIWARDRAGRFYLLQPGLDAAGSADFLRRLLRGEQAARLARGGEVSAVFGARNVGAADSRRQALAGAVRELEAAAGRGPGGAAGGADSAAAGTSPRPLRLAVIDDDPLIRTILERQLQSLEEEYTLEIRSFADGEEFLSDPWHAGGGRYLLVLDRMMPRMNGMEVLTRLRGGNYEPVYTVLMLTGVGDERGIAEAIRAGTDDYMTKPFSMVELEARVRRLLGKVAEPL